MSRRMSSQQVLPELLPLLSPNLNGSKTAKRPGTVISSMVNGEDFSPSIACLPATPRSEV